MLLRGAVDNVSRGKRRQITLVIGGAERKKPHQQNADA